VATPGYADETLTQANAVVNRYYMFKDRGIGSAFVGSAAVESGLYDSTANLVQDGTAAQQVAASNALATAVGWYVTLSAGEKVVGGSATLAGTVFFNTKQASAACAWCLRRQPRHSAQLRTEL